MKTWTWTLLLITVGVVGRIVPHAPNFSPMLAIALFSAAVLPLSLALVVPLISLFVGDVIGAYASLPSMGFHDLMWVVYLSMLPMVLLGFSASKLQVKRALSWGVAGLLASVFFFITTNLAVWWTSTLYPHTSTGLTDCFLLAIPFFHNTLLATWVYLAGLEGARRLQLAAQIKTA